MRRFVRNYEERGFGQERSAGFWWKGDVRRELGRRRTFLSSASSPSAFCHQPGSNETSSPAPLSWCNSGAKHGAG